MEVPTLNLKSGTGPKDNDLEFRRFLKQLISDCPKSRPQIADEMRLRSPFPITEHMLNDWTAESKPPSRRGRFPAFLIPVFCEVTGSDQLQRWAAGPRLRELLELGEKFFAVSYRKHYALSGTARRSRAGRSLTKIKGGKSLEKG